MLRFGSSNQASGKFFRSRAITLRFRGPQGARFWRPGGGGHVRSRRLLTPPKSLAESQRLFNPRCRWRGCPLPPTPFSLVGRVKKRLARRLPEQQRFHAGSARGVGGNAAVLSGAV